MLGGSGQYCASAVLQYSFGQKSWPAPLYFGTLCLPEAIQRQPLPYRSLIWTSEYLYCASLLLGQSAEVTNGTSSINPSSLITDPGQGYTETGDYPRMHSLRGRHTQWGARAHTLTQPNTQCGQFGDASFSNCMLSDLGRSLDHMGRTHRPYTHPEGLRFSPPSIPEISSISLKLHFLCCSSAKRPRLLPVLLHKNLPWAQGYNVNKPPLL